MLKKRSIHFCLLIALLGGASTISLQAQGGKNSTFFPHYWVRFFLMSACYADGDLCYSYASQNDRETSFSLQYKRHRALMLLAIVCMLLAWYKLRKKGQILIDGSGSVAILYIVLVLWWNRKFKNTFDSDQELKKIDNDSN